MEPPLNPKLAQIKRMVPMEKFVLFDKVMATHPSNSLWFITQPRIGKGVYETMLDPRTKSEKSEDSMDYHERDIPVLWTIAKHQRAYRKLQDGVAGHYLYRYPPPGVFLKAPFVPIERELMFHRPRDRYYMKEIKMEYIRARKSSRFSIREIIYRWKIFRQWCIATGSNPSHHEPYKWENRFEDINEELIMDRSRKNYLEDPIFPETKFQIFSTRWQRFQKSITQGVITRRKYWKRHRKMYKYRPALLEMYPGWKKADITRLREMFQKHDTHLEGFIDFDTMCELLDEIGDRSPEMYRGGYFNFFTETQYLPDDKIEYHEFLHVVYSLTNPLVEVDDEPDPDTPLTTLKVDPMDTTYRRMYQYYDQIAMNQPRARMFCNCF